MIVSKRGQNLMRAGVYSIDFVFELLNQHNKQEEPTEYYQLDGNVVKVKSLRYQVFERSLVCVQCGIKGTHFAAERPLQDGAYRFHFNLYATTADGGEVLMTKDHILPRSRGGTDDLYNLQTMCICCNNHKSNLVTRDIEFFADRIKELEDGHYVYEDSLFKLKDIILNAGNLINWDSDSDRRVFVSELPFGEEIHIIVKTMRLQRFEDKMYVTSAALPVAMIKDAYETLGRKRTLSTLKILPKELKLALECEE